MKTLRTPTIKAPVNYDPALLKSNHIYLAASDNEKVYVDDLFQQMPLYVRTYLLLHEEGHIISGHPHKHDLSQELEVDQYAVKKMSKTLVHKALLHIIKVFMKIDWTIAAEFMVRLNDLGYWEVIDESSIPRGGTQISRHTSEEMNNRLFRREQRIAVPMKPRQIVFYCKNCKCSTKISYDISGDPDKPVLDGVRIISHRRKRVISLKDTTEGKVVARADEAGKLYW